MSQPTLPLHSSTPFASVNEKAAVREDVNHIHSSTPFASVNEKVAVREDVNHLHSSTPFASVNEKEAVRDDVNHFFSQTPQMVAARRQHLRLFLSAFFVTVMSLFAVFSVYWGALWTTPVRPLPGWVVDFDGGIVGQTIAQALTAPVAGARVAWTVQSADRFPDGAQQVARAVFGEETWIAVTINKGASERLSQALVQANASYNGSEAVTVYAIEARNENAFRNLLRPYVETSLLNITRTFAQRLAQNVTQSTEISSILSMSPQTIITPISYTLNNLAPFNIPVASAVVFVGLLYQLVLAYFVVMFGRGARAASSLSTLLTTRSLIFVRLVSSFIAYFFLSFCYSLLNLGFHAHLGARFGPAGFIVFWMLNFVCMLACGLALESMITILTERYMPYFILLWIIVNIAVCVYPIETLPKIYRYGYASPFYNVSRAVRTVIFGTKNQVGMQFGILFVWILISCITLPCFEWFVRRRNQLSNESTKVESESNDNHKV